MVVRSSEERPIVSSSDQIDVYLETGEKRVFAGVIDWPGWSRSGRDEDSALQSLFDYGPRYASAIKTARLGFQPPMNPSALSVIEKLKGSSTTDFGAPDTTPSSDASPLDEAGLQRFQELLQACFLAFDQSVQAASGKELSIGPRGGGRDLDKIIQHVVDADVAYLSRLGVKFETGGKGNPPEELPHIRPVILAALASSAHGELPAHGPRGGARWTPRYFVRRVAWHILDHTWEIEDRSQ
jgi:hypothetical protein